VLRLSVSDFLQEGDPSAFEHSEELSWEMEEASICGLGMVAASPLISLRRHFPALFLARRPAASLDSQDSDPAPAAQVGEEVSTGGEPRK